MAVVRIPYGGGNLQAEMPDVNLLGIILPDTDRNRTDEVALLNNALACPIGTRPLAELARGRGNAVIIISDGTRMAPSSRFLPYIVAELDRGGISADRVTIVIGLGNHRPVTEEEKKNLIGPALYGRVKCIHSREAGFRRIGRTARGTPVDVCLPVLEADIVICTGSIEFHRLSGFSGGAKGVMPGVAGSEAITANHAMSDRAGVGPGQLNGNPVREDMEEFARIVGVDFLFNVVTDELGKIVGAYAGDLEQAHRAGCTRAEAMYRVIVDRPGDIVIVSPGGYPKDASVYQAQKAVLNALDICKTGGTVIVAARCQEGHGDEVFACWMEGAAGPAEVRERLEQGFVLGGHKAKTVLQAIQRTEVYWISDMPEQAVRKLFYHPAATLQDAVNMALARHGTGARIWALPYGGLCLPVLKVRDGNHYG
ncbi:MAG: nickel-dependent lactate racemase [Bacillota bacterium]